MLLFILFYLNDSIIYKAFHDIFHRNIIQNQSSLTNLANLEQLKNYPYSAEYQRNPRNGKMMIVYKCEYDGCGKEFLRTWNLLDHIRMHFGERPFTCQFCGKGFTQRGNMRKHLQQHYLPALTQRRKYKWAHCESSFTERYNFRVSKFY